MEEVECADEEEVGLAVVRAREEAFEGLSEADGDFNESVSV